MNMFLSYDPCEHGTVAEFAASFKPSQLQKAGGEIQAAWLSVHAPGPRAQEVFTAACRAEAQELLASYDEAKKPGGQQGKKFVDDLHQLGFRTG